MEQLTYLESLVKWIDFVLQATDLDNTIFVGTNSLGLGGVDMKVSAQGACYHLFFFFVIFKWNI